MRAASMGSAIVAAPDMNDGDSSLPRLECRVVELPRLAASTTGEVLGNDTPALRECQAGKGDQYGKPTSQHGLVYPMD